MCALRAACPDHEDSMKLIRGVHNLRSGQGKGSVVTIGNFDGVHLGHQVILRELKAAGARLGLPDVVMVFEPQPQEFFAGDKAPPRLMHWRDKMDALKSKGVGQVFCVRFDEAFRELTARDFVEKLLVQGLGCRHLVVGDDFRFGCDRSGDFALLQAAGKEFGFSVNNTTSVMLGGLRVSSTRIREAVVAGQFGLAEELLGAPYRISGHVMHGDKIGRTLGIPTANIALCRRVSPLSGIYAVRVHGLGLAPLYGAANVGTRPAVNGTDNRIEVHILDFNGDIYGRRISVEFCAKLREETNFPSLEALTVAIQKDIRDTRAYFGM